MDMLELLSIVLGFFVGVSAVSCFYLRSIGQKTEKLCNQLEQLTDRVHRLHPDHTETDVDNTD